MSYDKTDSRQEKKILHLIEVISESVENDEQALREAFEEEGLNYDNIVAEGLQFIRSKKREIRYERAREKQNRVEQLLKKVNDYSATKDELINTLKSLFSGEYAFAYFQKLESIEEDDLKKIINEAEILKLIENSLIEEDDID